MIRGKARKGAIIVTGDAKDNRDTRESERILDRVNLESDISSATFRHAREGDADDWIERTGTRIGRAAGIVLCVVLVVWLIATVFAGRGAP